MPNLNECFLMGNLTRDPELTYTPKGTAVAKFGLAINRNWTTEDGEKREEVTFVDLTAFGKTAETISQYVKKGNPLLVIGRLKLDQWDDKQTGQKRSKLHVIVERFQFVGGREDKDGSEAPRPRADKTAHRRPAAPPVAGDEPPASDDDCPF